MNRWSRQDRYGNVVYLTEERWQHVLESRPELEPYFNESSLRRYAPDAVSKTF